jgi:hypothetical protein
MNHIRPDFLKLALTASMLLWASITVSPATAASITFIFTGTVDSSWGPFSKNQAVMGSYIFESTTSNTGSGTTGEYKGALNGPNTNLNVTIGSYHASLAPGDNKIVVENPSGFSRDSYEVKGFFSGDVNGYAARSFELELEKPSTNQNLFFNGVALPTTSPSVSSFAERSLELVFGHGEHSHTLNITLNTLTAVPLPAAVILFGAGLVALIGLGAGTWRKRNKSLA